MELKLYILLPEEGQNTDLTPRLEKQVNGQPRFFSLKYESV